MAPFKRVLVGYDGGEHADDALALGRRIAERSGADLVLATIVPSPVGGSMVPALTADAYTELTIKAEGNLEAVAERLDAGTETEQSSSPARGLDTVARRIGADLIVVGSSPRAGRGQTRAGRKGRQLMSAGNCAVAIAPAGFRDAPALARIGVGLDGSPESKLAVKSAVELTPKGSTLQLIAVAAGMADEWGRLGATYPLAELADATREAAAERLAETAAELPESLHTEKKLMEGTAPIRLAEASAGLDLLCLGSRAYGPIRRVLLGSTSTDVVGHASSAVLVVPRTGED